MAAVWWETSPWPLRRERLYAVAGDSPLGLRLPLASLPDVLPDDVEHDPSPIRCAAGGLRKRDALSRAARARGQPREVIKTALVVEVRDGHCACSCRRSQDRALRGADRRDRGDARARNERRCVVEGYPPPRDPRIRALLVTPDPGVIEVNMHPASSWRELVDTTRALYEEARQTRLATEKFMLDGRHAGTGGGNHVTLGGATPADSPLLRRPDLLQSLIVYWQNHPALSYLFLGHVRRTDEPGAARRRSARRSALRARDRVPATRPRAAPRPGEIAQPWLVDRLLRHLLTDLTGNTHRAEFSIDKLYSPDTPTGRLGLLEFRAFEMPPHYRMAAVQMLLLRALVARFWRTPYRGGLIPWGTALHDRWLLPHFVVADLARRRRRSARVRLCVRGRMVRSVRRVPLSAFRQRHATTASRSSCGRRSSRGTCSARRSAATGTARYVDSSVERLQVKVDGHDRRAVMPSRATAARCR